MRHTSKKGCVIITISSAAGSSSSLAFGNKTLCTKLDKTPALAIKLKREFRLCPAFLAVKASWVCSVTASVAL